MIYPFTRHVASVIKGVDTDPEVKVYEVVDDSHTPAHYYFCCEGDGACGRHRRTKFEAINEAHLHLQEAHHGQA